MKCHACGEREGVVSLTHIIEGDVRTIALCAQCAAEKGIETAAALADTPLGGFLAALGESAAGAAEEGGQGPTCPGCGASLRDFRDTGRVGCTECYRSFEAPLRELLRRLHGSTHHAGMRYASPGAPEAVTGVPTQELREQLRRAIESEQFELAAELRDRLRERE